MSKKLYSTERWKKYIRRRQDDELRKKQRKRAKKRALRNQRFQAKRRARPKYVPVKAPTKFSLVQNPEAAVSFLRETRYLGGRYALHFDLSSVAAITPDAVAALIAIIRSMPETATRGNLPSDSAVTEILVEAGFFEHVRSIVPTKQPTRGRILRKQSKKVEPTFARDLIHIGTQAIHGAHQSDRSAYRVLIESMSNTHNHAAKENEGSQTWWATVYADSQTGVVCYTFLDIGVGIFRSLKLGRLRRMFRMAGVTDNTQILRDVLEGNVESRTGKKYRGKGLPAIYRRAKAGLIQSLVIIANDVYANIGTGEYRVLPAEFPGTLLYWEGH